jgi:hypothetical protein
MRLRFLPILLLAAAPWTASAVRAEGGPPAPDNRFFPKEMEDALAAMGGEDPEDAFQNGLAALARLRLRDGALEPMRKDAFEPIFEHGLSTRLEHVASFAGEILSALDTGRLATELAAAVDRAGESRRLFNAAVMLEECRWVQGAEGPTTDPVDVLNRINGKGHARPRIRACEALGELSRPRTGCPEKSREKAVTALLANYGAGGKDTDLRNVCAVALGKAGDSRAIGPLLSGLSQTDGKHCYFAALGLSWIEDRDVFASLLGGTAAAGTSGEAYCKALEGSAREENIESLLNLVASSGKAEVREAAAVALARLLPALPAPDAEGKAKGATPEETAKSALRGKAASILFESMVNERNGPAAWACFHALSRAGGPWLEESTIKLLRSPNPSHVVRAIHLSGDWKLAGAAKTLSGAIFAVKDDIVRLRCAIEFWRIGDRAAIDEFKRKLKEAGGGVPHARGCAALGTWRSREAFEFALDLLRSTREGSGEQFEVEKALETMTGHLFGPSPGLWNKWFEKNPGFFSPRQARIEREKWRAEFDKENKGFRQTKETEKAVQMGLDYLARHQHLDGRWDPTGFRECCDGTPPCQAGMGARVQEDPVSRTALGALAFLGAGYSPESGKFKTAIRRAMEHLMARQQACGDYLTNDLIGGYNRPVCLQAYAEAAALTHDPVYLPFVQRGADFLMQIQNSIGGWRYRVDVETSDSSVAAWMLFAMKAAEKAGASVREIVFEGTRRLFERYSVRVPQNGPREEFVDIDPSYGFDVGKEMKEEYRTGYQEQAYAPTHATTALGLMSHILLGYRRSHPFCIGSANHILAKQLPQVPKDGNLDKLNIRQEYPMYFMYYGTLSMHQMGGKFFRTWNDQVRTILPGIQFKEGCARGAWPGSAYDGFFGSLYTTSMGVLSLETYYRYLPVLQD